MKRSTDLSLENRSSILFKSISFVNKKSIQVTKLNGELMTPILLVHDEYLKIKVSREMAGVEVKIKENAPAPDSISLRMEVTLKDTTYDLSFSEKLIDLDKQWYVHIIGEIDDRPGRDGLTLNIEKDSIYLKLADSGVLEVLSPIHI